jgi:flagellar assembly protein FliH
MSSFEPLVLGTPVTVPLSQNIVREGLGVPVWLPAPVGDSRTGAAHNIDTREARDAEAVRLAKDAADAAQEAAVQAAFTRGFDEGTQSGEAAECARVRGAKLAAEQALDALRDSESHWRGMLEENVAAIAVAVAQQIIAQEVTASPSIVTALVSRAVREFGLDQALSIRVNPTDCAVLDGVVRGDAEAVMMESSERAVRWVSDARIVPGGCVVEGRERIVDGRVDTGLERLYRRLARINA